MNTTTELLDPNWIANILSISFTIVVFLLGLPMIFIQTFVPEELRKYYKVLQQKEQKELNLTAILLLLVILIFGNHGFKYFLEKVTPDIITFPFDIKPHLFLVKETVFIFYYLISLGFFLYLCYKVYVIFQNGVLHKDNLKKDIIEMVFQKFLLLYQNSAKGLSSADLAELIELREIYSSRIDRIIYNEKIFELIKAIVNSRSYDGEDVKMIYKNILFVSFVQEESIDNYTEITKLLNVTAMIAKQYTDNPNLNSFDSTYITQDFLLQMCLKLIKEDNIYLLNKFLRILQLFDTDQTTYFKIHYHAFQHSLYVVLVMEINRIIRHYQKGTLPARDRKPTIDNLIAYLAFFNSGNREMKKFAIKSTIALHPLITIKLCQAARDEFARNSSFDTADKISIAIKEYFYAKKLRTSTS